MFVVIVLGPHNGKAKIGKVLILNSITPIGMPLTNFDFGEEIVLENDAVRLRPLQVSDYDNLFSIATADKTLLQFSPAPIYSAELLEAYMKKALDARVNKARYPFIIFDKKQNRYAGSTSYLNLSNPDGRVEVGHTWLGREFQKTGLNRRCKFLLLSYAFDKLGFERIEFKTDERNLASRTAIEKIGGRFEGILRSHTVMYDGFRRNTYCYSILKNEWALLKADFLR
jgi:N-acetyltransferase